MKHALLINHNAKEYVDNAIQNGYQTALENDSQKKPITIQQRKHANKYSTLIDPEVHTNWQGKHIIKNRQFLYEAIYSPASKKEKYTTAAKLPAIHILQ